MSSSSGSVNIKIPEVHSSHSSNSIDVWEIVTIASKTLSFLTTTVALITFFGTFSKDQGQFFPNFTIILVNIRHLLGLILALVAKSDVPHIKRIWMGEDAHVMLVAATVYYSQTHPFIYYIAVIIYEGLAMVEVIDRELAPRAGQLESSVHVVTRPIIESKVARQVLAVVEILQFFYFFFYALFTFRGYMWICALFYFFIYVLYRYATDSGHRWFWGFLYDNIMDLAKKNHDSFGVYIEKALEGFKEVGDFAVSLYPTGFKIHFE